ncbi:MAG: ParB N-terminal domain-containing protein [Myxococcales bacterium]
MIWRGYLQFPVKKLKLPGDISQRQKQQHVVELAKSIEDNGGDPIHAPTVNADTMTLIAGRDRMAALLLNKAKKVWCHVMAEVSEEDARNVEIDENLHRRRDDRDELIARRFRRLAEEFRQDDAEQSGKVSHNAGRPTTAETRAAEKLARHAGVTPRAIRQAVSRVEGHSHRPGEEKETPKKRPDPPPVDTWGLPMAQDDADEVRMVQAAMDRMDHLLRNAQAASKPLEQSPVGARIYQRLKATLHAAAYEVRSHRPTAFCPYCKRLPDRVAACSGCSGIGYVGVESTWVVADELKRRGEDAVVVDGRGGFTRVASLSALAANVEQHVADADGNELTITMEQTELAEDGWLPPPAPPDDTFAEEPDEPLFDTATFDADGEPL